MRFAKTLTVIVFTGVLVIGYQNCAFRKSEDSRNPNVGIPLYSTDVGNPGLQKFSTRLGLALGTRLLADSLCTMVTKCHPKVTIDSCLTDFKQVDVGQLIWSSDSLPFHELEKFEIDDVYFSDFEGLTNNLRNMAAWSCERPTLSAYVTQGIGPLMSEMNGPLFFASQDLNSPDVYRMTRSQWIRDGGHGKAVRLHSIYTPDSQFTNFYSIQGRTRRTVVPGHEYEVSAQVFSELPFKSATVLAHFFLDGVAQQAERISGYQSNGAPNAWTKIVGKYTIPPAYSGRTVQVVLTVTVEVRGLFIVDDIELTNKTTGIKLFSENFEENPFIEWYSF